MLVAEINNNNSTHNNKSKRALCKIYTKGSSNANLLNLITYKAVKLCSLENVSE